MNKDKINQLRDAIADNLTGEELIEVLGLDVHDVLDLIDNETLVDHLDELEEMIPSLHQDDYSKDYN